jgi:hypothetical protein
MDKPMPCAATLIEREVFPPIQPLRKKAVSSLLPPHVIGPMTAPPLSSGHIALAMAVAGGSANPVNLQYTAPALTTNPNEGGGTD